MVPNNERISVVSTHRSAVRPFTHSHRSAYQRFLVWITVLIVAVRAALRQTEARPIHSGGLFCAAF